MTLVKYQRPLANIFDQFFNPEFDPWSDENRLIPRATLPPVNIKEDEKSFQVEVAASGLKKDDFNIELNKNSLVISCEKETEKETKDEDNFIQKEFSYHSFSRSFTLPEMVKKDKISAKYQDGVLRVTIPKNEASIQTVKQIAVS